MAAFGAGPGQVQRGSSEGSGEGLGGLDMSQVMFKSISGKTPEKLRGVLVQSQVKFNTFNKVLGSSLRGLGPPRL